MKSQHSWKTALCTTWILFPSSSLQKGNCGCHPPTSPPSPPCLGAAQHDPTSCLPLSPSAAGCFQPLLSLLCSRSLAGKKEQCLQQPLPTPQAAQPCCRQAGYSQPAELRHLCAEGGVGYLSQRVVQHVPGQEAIRKNEVTAPYICLGHNPVHGCGPAAASGPRSISKGLSAGPWPHLEGKVHCTGCSHGYPGATVQPARSSVAAAAPAPVHPSRAATAT